VRYDDASLFDAMTTQRTMPPMRALIPLLILGFLLAAPAYGAAAETVVIPVRGILDRDGADRIERDMRKAVAAGALSIVLEIDLLGAPESGLVLADVVADLQMSVRVAALLRGRAPGGAVAVVLACSPTYAMPAARVGPIPRRGAVHERVAALLDASGLPNEVLTLLLPPDEGEVGLTADRAKELGLVDRTLANRAEAFRRLGVDPEKIELPEPERSEGRRQVRGEFKRPFLIPFEGVIDDTRAASVKRRVRDAEAAGADLVIFEVDSPGGTVGASLEIGDFIFDMKIPTIMLILEEAISGAALVSLAGDEIVMSASGLIGDCQPISIGPEGITVIGEKIQSPLRAAFRKYATENRYSTALAEAMVTQEMQVDRVTFADGAVFYLEPEERARKIAEHGPIVDATEAVKKDQLLTMHAREAKDFGFCGELVTNRADLLARFGLGESDLVILDETWAENTSRFLMGLKFILFILGIMALYMELKAPGFGVPGGIAIVCFVLFFSASSIAGIATELSIVLFLLGVGLLALELLVIPGFGIPGIAGALLIMVSLYMASVKYGLPESDRPWETTGMLDWLLSFGGSILLSVLGMFVIAKFFPGTPIGRRMILAPAGPPGSQGLTGSGSMKGLEAAKIVGMTGVALTDLRPVGRIEVEGEPWNAVTEGDWVEKGSAILVIEVSANRIVIKGITS